MASIHDRYYWRKIEKIYGVRGRSGIINDRIKFGAQRYTRAEILDHMLDRHNNFVTDGFFQPVKAQTCASFLGAPPLDRDRILDKLCNPSGHAGLRNWNHWTGTHRGNWIHDNGREYQDDAIWHPARNHLLYHDGSFYHYQPVDFLNPNGSLKRNGWNQSHPDLDFVWGYDPKPGAEHCGIKFRQGGQRGIFWFTEVECYLELIYNHNGTVKRTSTGLHGVGQWFVEKEDEDQASSSGGTSTITGVGPIRRARPRN